MPLKRGSSKQVISENIRRLMREGKSRTQAAIQVCVNRFDDETKQAFLELYDKVDADFEMPVDGEEVA